LELSQAHSIVEAPAVFSAVPEETREAQIADAHATSAEPVASIEAVLETFRVISPELSKPEEQMLAAPPAPVVEPIAPVAPPAHRHEERAPPEPKAAEATPAEPPGAPQGIETKSAVAQVASVPSDSDLLALAVASYVAAQQAAESGTGEHQLPAAEPRQSET